MSVLFRLIWLPVNILQVLLIWAWTSLGVLFSLFVTSITRRPEISLRIAHRVWAPVALAFLGGSMKVEAEEDPDWSKTRIYVCNHQSMADIPALFKSLRTPLRFIAKKELFSLPIVGWYLRSTGMIPIDRGNRESAMRTLDEVARRDLEGSSILAFPEGTRSRDGEVGRFKLGVFVLALQAGLPVVPVAVEGTRHLVSRSGVTGRPARVQVRIGRPIDPGRFAPGEHRKLAEAVRAEVVRLHAEDAGQTG